MPRTSTSKSPPTTRSRSPSTRRRRPTSKVLEQHATEPSKRLTSKEVESTPWEIFSSNAEKRWTEKIFLLWAFCGWIPMMAVVIATSAYEHFGPWSYLIFTSMMALPCWIIPLVYTDRPGANKPILEQYWFKDNVWIFILSYVGNYFWTHYFYNLLGATYTFHAHRINNVPLSMFLATHAYFCFYHALTNISLRIFWQTSVYKFCQSIHLARFACTSAFVFILSWITAFMETFTIQGFPYYHIEDRTFMYTIGSVVYGTYFIVSFPMHYRLEPRWSLSKIAIESLASCMLVTILLDLCRLVIGLYGLKNEFCM